jgi:hypothetical protein
MVKRAAYLEESPTSKAIDPRMITIPPAVIFIGVAFANWTRNFHVSIVQFKLTSIKCT